VWDLNNALEYWLGLWRCDDCHGTFDVLPVDAGHVWECVSVNPTTFTQLVTNRLPARMS